jgi:hypothetical protein
MALYEFFTSRNNGSNAASYIGQAGRLFYDSTNGVVKLSDGTTPGGTSIPYTIATTTAIGGIKAGPGANVSVDGTLTIDTAGLPTSFGNLSVVDTTMTTVNANADLILASNGTGNVELRGNVHFHTTTSPGADPFFTANSDGQITMLVPAADPLAGAVKIVGSTTGGVFAPLNTGVMLQLTGNINDPSRFYNDAVNNFVAFVGRRLNGTLASPQATNAGDEFIRISATGHDGNTIPNTACSRILFQSLENHTPTARGANLSFWTTAIGSTALVKTATFDSANGLTVTKATVQGNLTAANISPSVNNVYNLGSPTMRWKSSYVGVDGLHIRDTNNTTDAVMTITNGVLYINGIEGLTAGNLYFQDNSILSLLPNQDIIMGNVFPGEGNIVMNRVTNFTQDIHTVGNLFTAGSVINNGMTTTGNIQGQNLITGGMTLSNNRIYSTLTNVDITIGQTIASANIVLARSTAVSKDLYANGNVYVASGKIINTPKVIINDGGIRDIQDGIWANLSFGSDSIVHSYNPSGDMTVNLNGYAAGSVIRLIISMDTRRSIALGVAAARNSTTGATSVASTSLVNNQCVQLVYTCIDGTAANTYVAVSRV